ncbi:MAG: UDP-N-acetylmuramoyl-L-alanine--D-glutamate ligase [Nitrospinae bacterium]|nr:UDP-N-acetylmuramoyl-L-alanine--D-glutamate ligase [Nitrospinota bacterium]
MIMDLKNKIISVIGMGKTGVATANFLSRRGARVSIMDSKPGDQLSGLANQVLPEVEAVYENCEPLADSDLVVISPGVDIGSGFLEKSRQKGTEIISEIELASRVNSAALIGVTGTNGKSTCTRLIEEILVESGKNVQAGGNLGTPFISLFDQGTPQYRVLEISSFQMEATHSFHPRIAIILNITPDHLDRHKSFEQYAGLKEKIYANQTEKDFLILNHDDPKTSSLGTNCPARKIFFSLESELETGSYIKQEKIFARINNFEGEVFPLSSLSRGLRWQVENVLPAVATALLLEIPLPSIKKVLENFKGLEHRLEWVCSRDGVDYINDSKGTNVGSACKSLNTFDRPIILIAGGKDKNADFSPLKKILKEKVKHLVLIGETRPKFRSVLNGSFGYEESDSLEDAVRKAKGKAEKGDVVLFSPACASFDMFKDFIDRGNQFKSIVNNL